jgi:phosphatidylglycerol:prolipoprotein diacylglycerol transferase
VSIILLARRLHYPAGQLFDLAAPATALGAFFGYLGAFLNGSSYGAETNFFWGVPQVGLPGRHHPSQLLEAALQLGLFLLLTRLRPRVPFSGFLALVYLIVYSLGRFALEFLRGDGVSVVGPISEAHVISFLIGLAAGLLLYLRLARLQGSWRIDMRKILAHG